MNKRLRILVLVHEDLVPPDSIEGLADEQWMPVKTEFDVTATLREMGHEVRALGVGSDFSVVTKAVEIHKPDMAFNLLEEFGGVGVYDAHVVSFLEMISLPYTGSNPRGLMLAHNKAVSKMICRYHRISVPDFHVFPMGRKVRRPAKLAFPLLVKSLTEEGSIGIAEASVVHSDEQLTERVDYVHRKVNTDAIAEQYIDGREFYVGVLGNDRLQTFPPFELIFKNLREGAPNIATSRIKWDNAYREKTGVDTVQAELDEALAGRIAHFCKRAYRALMLSGYARMDLRLAGDGKLYLLEANPNPEIAYGEDYAESAERAGIGYEQLLQRILRLGFTYRLRGQA